MNEELMTTFRALRARRLDEIREEFYRATMNGDAETIALLQTERRHLLDWPSLKDAAWPLESLGPVPPEFGEGGATPDKPATLDLSTAIETGVQVPFTLESILETRRAKAAEEAARPVPVLRRKTRLNRKGERVEVDVRYYVKPGETESGS